MPELQGFDEVLGYLNQTHAHDYYTEYLWRHDPVNGRAGRITPGDLVGAIANETNLVGREIGPIKIAEKFSTVGVPDHAVDHVIDAMKRTTLKGKKTTVRRFTPGPRD